MSEQKALDVIKDFAKREQERGLWESLWDEIADLVEPNMSRKFRTNDYVTPGERKTDRQMDSAPTVALTRFAAILDSLLTPRNQTWHRLVANDQDLMKDHSVQLYFEKLTRLLFQMRYAPTANFSTNNQLVYRSLGAFGSAAMFVDRLIGPGGPGLRYRAVHVGEMFPRENHQGIIDDMIRRVKLSANQLNDRAEWRDQLPDAVTSTLGTPKADELMFTVLHRVRPRADHDPEALDARAMPYESLYVLKEYPTVLEDGGYRSFPYAPTRYEQAPGETYGRSPAMQALPAIKSLMVQKRVLLTQGHRAMNPVILVPDDGTINAAQLRPGAIIPGAMNADGSRLMDILPTGSHEIGKDLMDDERAAISAAFLVELFQILQETPRMTATEVLERAREKGMLLAPTVGRQQSEYLGPMIQRELDLLAQLGLMPEIPPALQEADGEYDIAYDSPLSRVARADEAAGFNNVMAMINPILAAGRLDLLDNFDFDMITRGLADNQAVPASWLMDPKMVAAIREQRAAAQQQAQEQENGPEALKAAAAAKKAGLPVEEML